MKCSFQELHIPFIILMSLCQTYTHSGPICLTYSGTSPLTLCVWPAVPFMLIKTTNAPTLSPAPFAHTPLPSALITEPSVLLIGMISSPPPSQPSTRSLPERQRPSPLTGGHSSSTTTLLQRGKEEDKGIILIYSASSNISIVIAISQITPLSIYLLPW